MFSLHVSTDHQFSQNPDLGDELSKTRGTTLVEAAPRDTVWGIGLSAKSWKAKNRKHWRGNTNTHTHSHSHTHTHTHTHNCFNFTGRNLLGEILTEVREELESTHTT